jgi:hypothetical protein
MLSFYDGDQPGKIPGIFPLSEGYYWWMGGAAWDVDACQIKLTLGVNALLVAYKRLYLQ